MTDEGMGDRLTTSCPHVSWDRPCLDPVKGGGGGTREELSLFKIFVFFLVFNFPSSFPRPRTGLISHENESNSFKLGHRLDLSMATAKTLETVIIYDFNGN